MVKRLKYDFA